MTQAVFFDVGDTLILGHPKLWLFPLLEQRGLQFDAQRTREAIQAAYGAYNAHFQEAKDFESALPLWRTFHRNMMRELGLEAHADEIADYLADHWNDPSVWPLAPGAREVLEQLKAWGYRLAVVSNWDGMLPSILEAIGLTRYFDYLAVSALEGVTKPDPRIFQAALNALSVPPSATIHIGDSVEDVEGAKAAGITPILFDAYGRNPEALHDLRELLPLLKPERSI
jgi:REG-2-like HAD superfamily hydrolase